MRLNHKLGALAAALLLPALGALLWLHQVTYDVPPAASSATLDEQGASSEIESAASRRLPIHRPSPETGAMLWGFIDARGQLKVPYRYSRVAPFSEGRARVEEVPGKVYFIDIEGAVVSSHYADASSFAEGRAAVMSADGKWGYIDSRGHEVIPPRFLGAEPFAEGRAAVRVKVDEEYRSGFIDPNGAWIVEPRFDAVSSYHLGRAWATLAWRWGFVDRRGTFAIAPRFQEARPFMGGLAAVRDGQARVVSIDGPHGSLSFSSPGEPQECWNFVRPNGILLSPKPYREVSDFRGGIAAVECDLGMWTFIDSSGSRLSDCRHEKVCLLADGVGLSFHGAGGGLDDCVWPHDTTVELVSARPLSATFDRVVVREVEGGVTFASLRGRLRSPLLGQRFSKIQPFSNGLTIAQDEQGRFGVVDDQGRLRLPFRSEQIVKVASNLAIFVEDVHDCYFRYGALDFSGRTVIESRYAYLGEPSEGLIAACTFATEPLEVPGCWDEPELTCGYLREDGRQAFQFDHHRYWLNNLLGSRTLSSFRHGLAAASNKDGLAGYVDPTGQWRIRPKFGDAEDFAVIGLAPVDTGSLSVELNFAGAVLKPRVSVSELDRYNLAVASSDDNKKGLRDRDGNWVVAPQHDRIEQLDDGHFITESGPLHGLLDANGKSLLPQTFHAIEAPSEGLVAVLTKVAESAEGDAALRWGYVDLNGRFSVPPSLPQGRRPPGPFRDGIACVEIEPRVEAYIDRRGKVLARASTPLCEMR